MSSTSISLTREELFERIWSKPVREVAAELGISDVGLSKACRRSGIPLPPQGYWIRRHAPAQARVKPRLPAPRAGQQVRFEFQPRAPEIVHDDRSNRADLQRRLSDLKDRTTASVPAVERFIKAARRSTSKRIDERGIMRCDGPLPWPVRTSPSLAERAATVLGELLIRLSSLGHELRPHKDRPDMAVFNVHGIDYWIWLEEHSLRSDRQLTAKELSEKKLAAKQGTYFFAPNKWLFTPSGKLHAKLAHAGSEYVWREWAERGSKKVEERLDDIAIGIVEHAAEEKKKAEDRARLQAQEEALELRERERLQRLAHDRLKRASLLREAQTWEKAIRLHRYIDAVESAALSTLPEFQTEVARQRWITWARAIAGGLNPLQSGSVGESPPLPPLPDLPWGSWSADSETHDSI